jgi:biotin operon repressor/predicted phosphodiesterase
VPDLSRYIEDELTQAVREALKRKRKFQVDVLADQLDVSPKRIREAIQDLRDAGFRIPAEAAGAVELLKIAPTNNDTIHKLPLTLLDGDRVRFGVVSDTHLSSNEEALPELHLAYDHFVREQIDTVLHAGDLVAGLGIFPGQVNEIKHHTYEAQCEYAEQEYPQRDGVITRIIGGNHDLEGAIGRLGADPVQAVANKRDDIDYLGPYSAWIELANGGFVHLLHGKGGMSYAYSYKAQKIVDGYGQGRKPGALILGHYHVQGNFSPRSVNTMFPACFEWQSIQFGARLGLRPTVGFHIVECRLADDGTFVEWTPRWFPFIEGRRAGW